MKIRKLDVVLAIALLLCLAFSIYQYSNASTLKKDNDRLLTEKNELDKQISALNTEVSGLKSDYSALQTELTEASEANTALVDTDQKVQQEIAAANATLKQCQAMLANMRDVLGMSQAEVSEENPTETTEPTSIIHAQNLNRLTDMVFQNAGLIQSGVNSLHQTVQDQVKQLNENEKTIQSINSELKELKEKLTAAETTVQEKDTFIKDCETKIAEYEAQLTMMRTTVDEWLTPPASEGKEE